YCVCLRYELAARGLQFTIQQHIPITYKEVALAASHRVDLFRIKA
ncbi:MAG: GxxExxY protein, partial [Acidobacteria bacterium]